MPTQSYIAALAQVVLQFKPSRDENGKYLGWFYAIDPANDKSRDDLLLMIGAAIEELHQYIEHHKQIESQYMTLVEVTSDAHALMCHLGYNNMPLFESIQLLHDKYMQMTDLLLKLATQHGTADQLRQIAEQGLVFFGASGKEEAKSSRNEKTEDLKS
jgi:hypothetical protein